MGKTIKFLESSLVRKAKTEVEPQEILKLSLEHWSGKPTTFRMSYEDAARICSLLLMTDEEIQKKTLVHNFAFYDADGYADRLPDMQKEVFEAVREAAGIPPAKAPEEKFSRIVEHICNGFDQEITDICEELNVSSIDIVFEDEEAEAVYGLCAEVDRLSDTYDILKTLKALSSKLPGGAKLSCIEAKLLKTLGTTNKCEFTYFN